MIRKVCGMREAQNIRDVEALGIDWMGFIFWEKTKRNVAHKPDYLPEKCKRVGVFVDADIDFIEQKQKDFGLNIIQLHGNESPEFCNMVKKRLGTTVMKAFSFKTAEDVAKTNEYEGACDYFLFDTPTPNAGGSGKMFDWSLLESYKGNTPFILSGGIGIGSVEALKAFSHNKWAGIDVNSKFEVEPALKDVELLRSFFESL
ncbi:MULTISPECIES: phosphoribosylanthranilate isomerase [unclassified Bacteroides]|uniref:phosphoribosylanthranilate isomerase n=1 Tax=unclassified Bacteroides TaxID=2646097 RepID=UPI0004E14F3D|nr:MULTISPECIES: phosphoribosylanthranilate isomerase [unclassified Bacteroides]